MKPWEIVVEEQKSLLLEVLSFLGTVKVEELKDDGIHRLYAFFNYQGLRFIINTNLDCDKMKCSALSKWVQNEANPLGWQPVIASLGNGGFFYEREAFKELLVKTLESTLANYQVQIDYYKDMVRKSDLWAERENMLRETFYELGLQVDEHCQLTIPLQDVTDELLEFLKKQKK